MVVSLAPGLCAASGLLSAFTQLFPIILCPPAAPIAHSDELRADYVRAETLCMKGIIYYNTGKKEDGFALVRKGIQHDLTSHICWHVKALLHKADRDLEQAMACYSQAIKIEKVRLLSIC